MSKQKKAAFAEKQRAAAARPPALVPLDRDTPMPKTATKPKTRKQSRGK